MPRGADRPITDVDRDICGQLRAEAGRLQLGRKDLEAATGMKRTRLRETVYEPTRSLLISELEALCNALGIAMSAVVTSAEMSVRRPMLRVAKLQDDSEEVGKDFIDGE